jgi:GNAT superfamily N-acetyltransferase
MKLIWRQATKRDCPILAELNHQLIADEGHRNPMSVPELEQRMRGWLDEGYEAVLFEADGELAAYALYCARNEEVYLRHFLVVRHRRRQGIGRQAIGLLRERIWPKGLRLTVSVLTHNEAGVKFWRAMGYEDYCLTLEIMPPGAAPPHSAS